MPDKNPLSKSRRLPTQKRSEKTLGKILDAAAELLEELGFDKLNTNLICERAGLTPPALYRYFPNKYAVLKELGARLMQAQNEALYETLEETGPTPTVKQIAGQLRGQYDVTVSQKGAAWIMRALHATPQLVEVRRSSHREMARHLSTLQQELDSSANPVTIERRSQIVVETGYAVLEMLVDGPNIDIDAAIHDVAVMIFALVQGQSLPTLIDRQTP